MGLTITDTVSLVTKGYKADDIKEVKALIDSNPDEEKNIIDLAKKLGFSEFKMTMQLFTKSDDTSEDQETSEDKPDNFDASEGENHNEHDVSADQGAGEDVDYKKLYETEKALRTRLQQDNQNADTSGKGTDNRSDFDIAVAFASDILN